MCLVKSVSSKEKTKWQYRIKFILFWMKSGKKTIHVRFLDGSKFLEDCFHGGERREEEGSWPLSPIGVHEGRSLISIERKSSGVGGIEEE